MAIGDFPRIPTELNDRIRELTQKIEDAEIQQDDVIQAAVTAVGKTRIDNNGIRTFGDFGEILFDSDDLNGLIESGGKGIDLFNIMIGKMFYVKTGNKIERIQLGYIPKITEVNHIPERDEEDVPIVEFKPDEDGNYPEKKLQVLMDYLKKRFGEGVHVRDPGFVIHNLEAFAGFLQDWKEFALLMEMPVSLLEMTTKKKITRTGESAFLLIEDILTRCGV